MEEDIKNYNEITFEQYVRHKGIPEWEIAWNKKMKNILKNDDPTGRLREKREENIKYWEGIKNVKTST